MKKTLVYVTAALAASSVAVLTSRSALSSGQTDAVVRLQPTAPGIQQTGNVNISGTLQSGAIKVPTGAGSGKVLTSDAVGNANWANPTLIFPYTASANVAGNTMVTLTNTTNSYGSVIRTNGGYLGIEAYVNSALTYATAITGYSQTAVDGIGVYGQALGANGFGVYGYGSGSGSSTGGFFGSSGQSGVGVHGEATSVTGSNFGGQFSIRSPEGAGVYAESVASNGGFAAHFVGNAYGTAAVQSENNSPSGGAIAGYFISGSPDSRALYGLATSGSGVTYGVVGQSNSATGGVGVWGTASPNGYAVQAIGNLAVSGNKSFRIDDPRDPENRYLFHYCAEGPEPLNVYSGSVVTDASGHASVELPEYFELINRDPRIQLTVDNDGEDMVFAMAMGGVKGRTFRLKTSKGRVKVYWEVKAVRNDPYVRRYGAPVEVEKPESLRGTYQHPELYGASPDRAENADPLHPGTGKEATDSRRR